MFVFQQRRSNWSQVVLRRVVPALSGRYSCEVSADAPSFHTALVSGDMNVVGEQIDRLLSFRTLLNGRQRCSLRADERVRPEI